MKQSYTSRILVLIILLAALIIAMSVITQQKLRKDSEKLKASIDTAVKYTETSNWKGAESSLDEIGKIWSGVKGTWSALIDHEEIDNIDVSLAELRMTVNAKELPDSLSKAAALKTYIGHIPEKERLKPENLF